MLILLVFLFSKSIFLSISLGTHLLYYLHSVVSDAGK